MKRWYIFYKNFIWYSFTYSIISKYVGTVLGKLRLRQVINVKNLLVLDIVQMKEGCQTNVPKDLYLHFHLILIQVSYCYYIRWKIGPNYRIDITLGRKFVLSIVLVSYRVENLSQVLYRYHIGLSKTLYRPPLTNANYSTYQRFKAINDNIIAL